jgi:hypothetical protein
MRSMQLAVTGRIGMANWLLAAARASVHDGTVATSPGSANRLQLQSELQFANVRRYPLTSAQARDLHQWMSEDGQRIRAADS